MWRQARPLAAAAAAAGAPAAVALALPRPRPPRPDEELPGTPHRLQGLWLRHSQQCTVQPVACAESRSSGAGPSAAAGFESLQAIDDRLRLLQERSVPFLSSFWHAESNSFAVAPMVERISLTSSCWSLLAILEDPQVWKGYVSKDAGSKAPISLPAVGEAILERWVEKKTQPDHHRGLVALTLLKAGLLNCSTPEAQKLLHAEMEELVKRRPKRRMGTHQPASAYVRYWMTKALLELTRSSSNSGGTMLPPELAQEVSLAVHRALEVSYIAMCQQLSFFYAGDRSNFDVIELAYNLLTYYLIERSTVRLPALEEEDATWALNMKMVEKALAVVFGEQNPDGLWGKGRPINVDKHHVGNSYVYTFDLLGSFVEEFSAAPELLEQFVPHITRSVQWAEENVVNFAHSEKAGGHLDLVRGWRSNHLDETDSYPGPYAWSTAQVVLCMARIRRYIQYLTNRTVLHEFRGSFIEQSNRKPWELLLDADLQLQGNATSLKTELETRMLTPMEALVAGEADARPVYSAILFGPPGTAKTTICKAMAYRLGWNFLTIDTGDFLKDGLNGIAARMEYIFRRLQSLDQTVILFDEIEEFCLNREDKSIGMESRMLTTAMLTQINELRRRHRCVFFVATNRLTAFDSAIIRPGRFDALLFVGTPSLEARLGRVRSALAAKGCPEGSEPSRLAEEFCKEHYSELRFLNFAEGEALALRMAQVAASGSLTQEALQHMLADATATATIRGPAREELLAMAGMSRA